MRLIAGFIFVASFLFAQSAADHLELGRAAFKSGHYAEAVQHFQEAVRVEPGNVTAHIDLATAVEMQFVPGLDSPENVQFAEQAKAEFKTVLGINPNNVPALASLASLAYSRKQSDEAMDWNRKVVAIDPANKQAFYTMGVLAWSEWLPIDRQARTDSGQRPDDPGPIGNTAIREGLKAKWLPVLDQGIQDLEAALRLDADYDDAMAYMNLLIRYRADLLDTPEQYRSEAGRADEWVTRALESKKNKAQTPETVAGGAVSAPQAIRVGGPVAAASLISKVTPVYPPLARQALVSGTVRFNVLIDKEGHIEQLTLISGHPLLVQAAHDAVAQWVYKPTLLNGQPVKVLTTIDVNFSLLP